MAFPLFGFDLADNERLRTEKPVTWSGTTRAAMPGLQVYPRTASGSLLPG